MKGFRYDICLYAFLIGLIFSLVLCLFLPKVSASEIPEEPTETVEEVIEEIETTEETEEPLPEEPEPTPEVITEIVYVEVPAVDELPDDEYQAYMLGCMVFFVAVVLFYFSYKFIKMFF